MILETPHGRIRFPEGTSQEEAQQRYQAGVQAGKLPPLRTPMQRAGRQLALGTRNVAEGIMTLPDMAANVFRAPMNAALEAMGSDRRSGSFSDALTAMGAPVPETGLEQVMAMGQRGAGAALGGVGLGALAAPAGGVAGGVGQTMAANPATQLAAGFSGGGSAGIAEQMGAGPLGQAAAGIGGGLAAAGGAPMLRSALGGGPQAGQTAAQFRQLGMEPTAGQATQGRLLRATESGLSRFPGSAGVMQRAAGNQGREMGAAIEQRARALAPRADSPIAGAAIDRGITQGFIPQVRARANHLYGRVDRHMPAQTPVALTRTQRVLDELATPATGAQRTTGRLIHPLARQLRDDLRMDAEAALPAQMTAQQFRQATQGTPQATLPYSAVKGVRSRIGERLQTEALVNDLPRAQVKRIYAALSEDIRSAAGTPEARRALAQADRYWARSMDRVERLQRIVNQNTPEGVFRASMAGTREGGSTIREVMRALPHDERQVVTSTVIRQMGRANPGQQVMNEAGDFTEFSVNRFLTQYAGMHPEARRALFQPMGRQFQQDMDSLAAVASNLRQGSQVFSNPSGTGQTVAQLGMAGSAAIALLNGNLGTVGAIGGTSVVANVAARGMTNPAFVNWLAQSTRLPAATFPAQVAILADRAAQTDDEDLALLASWLSMELEQLSTEPEQ